MRSMVAFATSRRIRTVVASWRTRTPVQRTAEQAEVHVPHQTFAQW